MSNFSESDFQKRILFTLDWWQQNLQNPQPRRKVFQALVAGFLFAETGLILAGKAQQHNELQLKTEQDVITNLIVPIWSRFYFGAGSIYQLSDKENPTAEGYIADLVVNLNNTPVQVQANTTSQRVDISWPAEKNMSTGIYLNPGQEPATTYITTNNEATIVPGIFPKDLPQIRQAIATIRTGTYDPQATLRVITQDTTHFLSTGSWGHFEGTSTQNPHRSAYPVLYEVAKGQLESLFNTML